jgi:hypothetical protein
MSSIFVLDANAFIQARRRFYDFSICPGYWDALHWHASRKAVCSIDRVWAELERGGDVLWDWAKEKLTDSVFHTTASPDIVARYSEMIAWVHAQPFLPNAKEEFAREEVADGWLAAYAKSQKSAVVVTLEEFDPNVKRRVPLPNVCRAFELETISPYEMLRRLGIKLEWRPPG